MMHFNTGTKDQEAAERHLAANAVRLAGLNILVHVDTVSPSRHVAYCSVEQRHHGWLWHTFSVEELIWRAEQALAPLLCMGMLPLVTVRHRTLHNDTAATPQRLALLLHWYGKLITWSGAPMGRRKARPPSETQDPFGWRSALAPGPRHAPPPTGGGPLPPPVAAGSPAGYRT